MSFSLSSEIDPLSLRFIRSDHLALDHSARGPGPRVVSLAGVLLGTHQSGRGTHGSAMSRAREAATSLVSSVTSASSKALGVPVTALLE